MSKNEKKSWLEFMKKIGCKVSGYRFMTETEKQVLAWAVMMEHVWDRAWAVYVHRGSPTSEDMIQKELAYVEYRKWCSIVSKLRQAQLA